MAQRLRAEEVWIEPAGLRLKVSKSTIKRTIEIRADRMRVELTLQGRRVEDVKRALDMLRPRMQAVLAQYQISSSDGDDLRQETVLATLERWEEIENLEAWLLTVFRYRCSIHCRRRSCWKRLILSMDPEDLQTVAKPIDPPQEHQDLRRDVRRLLRQLSSEEVYLLSMRFEQGLGMKEVAARLGCHPANVPKMLRRLLARLKAAAELDPSL